MPAKKPAKKKKSTYTEYKVAQAVARLADQINQFGVTLATVSSQLRVLSGMEARLVKKFEETVLAPSEETKG